jgi:hypothetical protein
MKELNATMVNLCRSREVGCREAWVSVILSTVILASPERAAWRMGMIFGKSHRYAVVLALSALLVAPLVGCGGGGGTEVTTTPTPDATVRAIFSGRVVDFNSGDISVAGAVVSFNGASTTTANDGTFTLQTTPTTETLNARVVGPNNNYYNTGYVNGTSYNVVNPGFPVPPTAGGASRDLGVIKIATQDGPPPPPPI